jgi:hypothetical protein
LNKAIARRWARALRSGKYKQGRRYLKQKDADGEFLHCCLGVLCELYQAERARKKQRKLIVTVEVNPWNTVCSFKAPRKNDIEDTGELPTTVMRWAGMRTGWGDYTRGKALTLDNDTHRKSFRRIATVIEKNVDKL